MSRSSQLVLSVFFAACEQSSPSHNPPVFPAPAPVDATVADEPPPGPKPAVAPVQPRPTRTSLTPEPPAQTPAVVVDEPDHPPGKGHWSSPGCRPGSRMACRWVPETDERTQPRVKKSGDPK
jgi:hypothetical protein